MTPAVTPRGKEKRMTFELARRKLAKIAKGEYHAILYGLRFPSHKMPAEVECKLYIHNYDWHTGTTWAEAFKKLLERQEPRAPRDRKEQPKAERPA